MTAKTTLIRQPGLPCKLAIVLFGAVLHSGLLAGSPAWAQEDAAGDDADSAAEADALDRSTSLAFHRERFTYLAQPRRDPFLPPTTASAMMARSGNVGILGILHHADSRFSVVVLASGRGDARNDGSGQGDGRPAEPMRLRLNGSVGDARVAEIHRSHVVLEATAPTGVVRRVLEIPRGSRRSEP